MFESINPSPYFQSSVASLSLSPRSSSSVLFTNDTDELSLKTPLPQLAKRFYFLKDSPLYYCRFYFYFTSNPPHRFHFRICSLEAISLHHLAQFFQLFLWQHPSIQSFKLNFVVLPPSILSKFRPTPLQRGSVQVFKVLQKYNAFII